MAHPHSLRGLEVRKGKHKTSIRIHFRYQGALCKETLNLTDSKRDLAQAGYVRGEVLNAIRRGTFDYAQFFPHSKNIARCRPMAQEGMIGTLLQKILSNCQRSLQADTCEEYEKAINTHLLPRWGNTQIRDMAKGELKDWIRSFTCKKKTVANILTPLRHVVAEALDDDLISSNPFDGIKLKKLLSVDQKRSNFVADPFSIEEIKAILSVCRNNQEYAFWAVAFASGMRPSEQIALEWTYVNFQVGKIYVEKKKVRGRTSEALKTMKARRAIDFRLAAYEALKLLSEEPNRDGRYVFIDERYGRPWSGVGALRRRFIRLCKHAGVRYRNPYQTRHTFASALLARGEVPLDVATQMGHTSLQMLSEHYAHWIDQGNSPHARIALDSFFSRWRAA